MPTLKAPAVKYDHFIGSLAAPVVMVEYGDIECPNTARSMNVIDQLITEFRQDLCYVFRHFPVPEKHPNSVLAALAVEAADVQGKFWKVHRHLLKTQKDFSIDHFIDSSSAFELDTEQFLRDMESEELLYRIQKDIDSGEESGVNEETPSFFLNGIMMEYPTNYDLLRDEIRMILQEELPHF